MRESKAMKEMREIKERDYGFAKGMNSEEDLK
jgi:hypothetical protein